MILNYVGWSTYPSSPFYVLKVDISVYFIVKMTKCDENPCKDRGYCLSNERDPSWYKCYCQDWFEGTDCESMFHMRGC